MFGRTWHLPHWGSDDSHPLRRQIALTVLVALLLATIALLLLPPHARGNFVYWSEASPNSSIGRAKINGTGLNTNFIPGLNNPSSVAADSKFIYWTDMGANQIGRANLDGTGVKPDFITTGVNNPLGIAVTSSGIYWANNPGGSSAVGHANIDGTNPVGNFIPTTANGICGLTADASFVYWTDGTNNRISRAGLSGTPVTPDFITGANLFCGPGVDSNFVYWATDSTNHVARGPVGGGTADNSFLAAGTSGGGPAGVAVNSQYIFWGNYDTGAIGRANINGSSPNPALIPAAGITGPSNPSLLVAAPSNKITVNSVTVKKKKGTAVINAKVPGPGQVTLNQTSSPPDANATAAAVKQVGLTITQASSFKLAVKPKGKTAKKLKQQVSKKGKGKVKVKVFIHFVPAGVAGVPNTDPLTVKLIKVGKKK